MTPKLLKLLFWKGVLFLSYMYMFAFTYIFWILCFYSQISDGRVLVFFLTMTVCFIYVWGKISYSKLFLRSLPHPGEKVWWLKTQAQKQKASFSISGLPFIGWVTLHKLFHFHVTQFPQVYKRDINISLPRAAINTKMSAIIITIINY